MVSMVRSAAVNVGPSVGGAEVALVLVGVEASLARELAAVVAEYLQIGEIAVEQTQLMLDGRPLT